MLRRMAAIALAAALLASGCTRPALKQKAQASPSPSEIASPAESPSAKPFAWTSCGGGFQCGTVTVPLDYANPGNGTIGIAVIRKPATNPSERIGSLLTNPGGPGASGIQFVRDAISLYSTLNTRFDIVGFDPRGVGQSAPVHCLDTAALDRINALDPILDDPAEKQADIDAAKEFGQGCMQKSPDIIPFVDTVSAARDMDEIRAALGDEKLTYLGFSYGTFLGDTYANLFPTHVRAMTLDAVVDPTLSPNDMLLGQLKGFEGDLDAFLADCRTRSTCQLAQGGDPETRLDALLADLDNKSLTVGSRRLTRGLAYIGVIQGMYSPAEWAQLGKAANDAINGDGSGLLALSDEYLDRSSTGYSNQVEANVAINCLDRAVPTDIAAYDALAQSYEQASPHFGQASQYDNLVCAYWPVKATGQPQALDDPGAPPIVLVGGTGDPATPYDWAVSVHKQMSTSVLVTRRGQGHGSYYQSACVYRLVNSYLIDLTVPQDGTTCTS